MEPNNIENIEVAERKYLKSNNYRILKILILTTSIVSFILFFIYFRKSNSNSYQNGLISDIKIKDKKILGHFPYSETSYENLVEITPNILVHKKMYKSLLKMRDDAQKDGVYLVFLSGFRSIELQKEIFYSLKSMRSQIAVERARVSAPPGYSEHSTGFAIDIGDALRRETDFEVEFETTSAFKWLEKNAAKYHFKLSFDKKQNSVDYEPWHWRYEGNIEALKIFEASNREKLKF
tara:strand:- start:581 stop:1285 length:705 start_codon:yes stop_codon:yes gene_type:complete